MSAIEHGSRVTLHFSLKLDNGQVMDSNFDQDPAELTVGDGNLPEGFERYLIGLKTGDQNSFEVPPEYAFGQPNPQNIQEMKRSDFAADMPISPGLVVSFADAQNTELPGVIKAVDGPWVTVDFNHPLAGKTLIFDVKIIDVQ